MALTDTVIRKSKAGEKRYKLTDGRGLFLLVQPSGGKLWQYKYSFAGKEKRLTLGPYPDVTLAMARERHQRQGDSCSPESIPWHNARQRSVRQRPARRNRFRPWRRASKRESL
jgi:hypothetical protein